ncbi:MAG: hypothetical protein K8R85_09330 [Bacteroidetes bacterium]|nr:hypothetical protein [Bacteroidota bacterium]
MKNNLRSIILGFIIIFSYNSKSQTLQTYNGTFEEGTATYQYYENEKYERIFHGNFEYKSSGYTITGKFKDNKRDGLWKATLTQKIYNPNSTTSEIVTANYINGNLEGQSNYTKTDLGTKKILAKANSSFKNNIPNGNFNYLVNDTKNNFSYNFFVNSKGFVDSTFFVKYKYQNIQYEDIQKYKNGYSYWRLFRNMTTGEIITKIEKTKFVDDIIKYYDASSNVSIVPYVEFNKKIEREPVLLFEKNGGNYFPYSKNKNGDTVFYQNTPFSYVKSSLVGYGSLWDLSSALNFWGNGNCQYCGSRTNPLYFFNKGANIVDYSLTKEFAINDKLLVANKKKSAIDNLKNVIDLSIEWKQIEGGTFNSKKIEPFSISSYPITESQESGFNRLENAIKNNPNKYDLEILDNCAETIRLKVSKKMDVYGITFRFSDQPANLALRKAGDYADLLGYRIATMEEINYINTKGFEFITNGYYFLKTKK